jgi:hypothetical protein
MSILSLSGVLLQMRKKRFVYAMFLDSGYGSIIDQKKTENMLGYNQHQALGKQTDCIAATKMQRQNPVAFGLTLNSDFR